MPKSASSRSKPEVNRTVSRGALAAALGVAVSLTVTHQGDARDILRGGTGFAPSTAGATADSSNAANAASAQSAAIAKRAQDVLTRTTQALQAMQSLQSAARSAAQSASSANNLGADPNHPGQTLPNVPDGLTTGGLQVAAGVAADLQKPAASRTLWTGASAPVETTAAGKTTVTITQSSQQAMLNWQTFNIGKNTTLTFDQTAGGTDVGQWIAFNKINDPTGSPSQILGSIKSDGQVYVINQNGIIFGPDSQVNTHALVASSLPINDNLVSRGLINNPDLQFLFSSLTVPKLSSGGTMDAFIPTVTDAAFTVSASGNTYKLAHVVASTSTPALSYTASGAAAATLTAGSDYSLSTDSNGYTVATFTTNGLNKIGSAPVSVTYTRQNTGDVTVQQGATLSSPTTSDHVGGKIALIGPNVTNAGTISAPDGQIILAAGQQVALTSHASNDPTLRGLDVWVGQGAGTAANALDGVINAARASVVIAGKTVNQLGFIDSTTSVALNGRIDLLANYNAVTTQVQGKTVLFSTASGAVSLGAGSVTQVSPELTSDSTVVGSRLTLSSQINLQGKTVYLGANAQLLAASGGVSINAGTWQQQSNTYVFFNNGGQIYLDSGAAIDVAGSTNVAASVTDNIVSVQLRGSELANYPTQRNGVLRGQTVEVDARQSGSVDGQTWVGTPLADVSGYVNLIQRSVGQLTTAGGSVTLNAGESVVMQPGSMIDVSGGWIQYKGGEVQTSRLISGSHIFDISKATSDLVYDGVYSGFTETHSRWNIAETFTSPLLSGAHYEAGYLEGASAGSITISAPGMALDGNLYGNSVTGPRQRSTAPTSGALTIAFQKQDVSTGFAVSPTPPSVTFQTGATLNAADAFALDSSGNAAPLRADRKAEVVLSPDLLNTGGFGIFTLADGDGNVTIPSNVSITAPSGGSVTLSTANLSIDGKVSVPGGSLSLTAYDYSPYNFLKTSAAYAQDPSKVTLPAVDLTRGQFTLGATASLSAAGLVIDDHPGSPTAEKTTMSVNGVASTATMDGANYNTTIVKDGGKTVTVIATNAGTSTTKNYLAKSITTSTSDAGKTTTTIVVDDGSTSGKTFTFDSILTQLKNGGSVAVTGRSVDLSAGSAVEVSGGLAIGGNGKKTYGKGGSITINAGQDPNINSLLGGSLMLNSSLTGYGGLGVSGGALNIKAPLIQVGEVAASSDTLLLSPAFFNQGGFNSFSLTGIGEKSSQADTFLSAVSIDPQTVLEPAAETRMAVQAPNGLQWETMLLPEGVRSPVSLTISAPGVKNSFTRDQIIRGQVVLGEGAMIQTDALANVAISGNTVAILGSIIVPGGNITLAGASDSSLLFASKNIAPTVDLGPQSALSTAGMSLLTPDPLGYRTGSVLSGGKISITGNIVAEAGAQIDVSGASGELDKLVTYSDLDAQTIGSLKGATITRTRVDSNGGSIVFGGGQELVSNATLRGAAGGSGAQGGSLTVFCGGNSGSPLDVSLQVTQADPVISTSFYPTGGTAIGHAVLDSSGNALAGLGYFGADSFNASGLDSLTLSGVLSFSGAVKIVAPRTINFGDRGVIYGDSEIDIIAPYVVLGTTFQPPQDASALQSQIQYQGKPFNISPKYGTGALNVAASLIDVGYFAPQNIGAANLTANNGDIRGNGIFDIAGDITMTAGQIYPASGVQFTVAAYDHNGVAGSVTINASGSRRLPLSAGGTLNIYGSKITQGGVLRAPLGSINIGWDGTGSAPLDLITNLSFATTTQITLTADGITSVSAIEPASGSGTTIPYGLNLNDSSWIAPSGTDISTSGPTAKSIELSAVNISSQAGATIDIRGGGDLFAYRFVKGTGGTKDILGSSASFAVIPGYGADYAPYAPFNNNSTTAANFGTDKGYVNSGLRVGDQVYLNASSGLPAGTYTLLPARYALLPGAFLVTPKSSTPAGTVSLPDGATLVTGYRNNDLSPAQAGHTLLSSFEIASSSVVAKRATYESYSANTFFSSDASLRLPEDSGRLVLAAKGSMALQGSVLAKAPSAGRGGTVDISSPADILIGDTGATVGAGVMFLDAAQLSAFGAESLLIGGIRSDDGTKISVHTNALTVDNSGSPLTGPEIILVANKAMTLAPGADIEQKGTTTTTGETRTISGLVELKSPGDSIQLPSAGATLQFASGTPGNDKIISTSAGTITYANGSTANLIANTATAITSSASVQLSTAGKITFANGGTGGTIPITLGDGLLVQVSSDPTATTTRALVTTYPGPKLTVGAGATISGASIMLDSTYATDLASSATLLGNSVSLNSGQISLLLGGQTVGDLKKTGGKTTTGLVLAGQALQTLTDYAQSLSLLSYSSIDIYGAGNIGSSSFESLALHAADLRGFNGSAANFSAKSIQLDNRASALVPKAVDNQSATLDGSLVFNAGTLHLGANQLKVDNFKNTSLNATSVIIGEGTGGLSTTGNLSMTTPVLTAATGANQNISAAGALSVQSAGNSTSAVTGGLGASLSLQGSSINVASEILLSSGVLTLHAMQGDVTLTGRLDVAGISRTFFDMVEYTDGGQIALTSDKGNVVMASTSAISVAAPSTTGNAGSLSIAAPNGVFTPGGRLLGQGGAGSTFSLDTASIAVDSNGHASLDGLDAVLNSAGFTASRSIRVRNGDVWVDGLATAHAFNLSADQGSITVSGIIDASGEHGGTINLSAHGSVVLSQNAYLSVAGVNFDSAGKGGAVSLEAGALSVDSSGTPSYDGSAVINLMTGSKIDLSVAANTADSASFGRYTGTLHLRAPQRQGDAGPGTLDVQIEPLNGTITGASKIVVEGYKFFTATDGSIDNQISDINSNCIAFAGDNGIAAPGYDHMVSRLFGTANAALSTVLIVQPGAEIINPQGDLTLASTWDFSSMRFGPNSVPGNLTLRAAGSLVFNGALSDGFESGDFQALLLQQNPLLPANAQSWSYRLVAGADLTAADFRRVQSLASLDSSHRDGSLQLGNYCNGYDPNPSYSSSTDLSQSALDAILTAIDGNYQVIRTGSGDIEIFAGRDVQLRNQFATIYTAGTQVTDPTMGGQFDLPLLFSDANKSAVNNLYPAQYSQAGGNVTIAAQRDIVHQTLQFSVVVSDSSRQLPTSWLYRRGYVGNNGSFGAAILGDQASTTWWVDFSNFFEGVGTLGGGNATVTAGRNISNIDVVAPTNARMPDGIPDAAKIVELGGGDVTVRAVNDIDGGVYYVERGNGTLSAGNNIALHSDNITRSPVLANILSPATYKAQINPMDMWLPTTLFLGKGNFDVSADGDVTLGPVANPFLLPQGLSNTYWYKTYFSTYATTDIVKVTSVGGNVEFKESASLPVVLDSSANIAITAVPLLQLWMQQQWLFTGKGNTAAYYQPWLMMAETSVSPFTTAATLMPSSLDATAFSGDINIVGNITLSPSPTGTINLLSAGAVNGLQVTGVNKIKGVVTNAWASATINLSDADPAALPGIATPYAYAARVKANSSDVDTQTRLGFLANVLDVFFNDSGSISTTGNYAVLQTKQALHADGLLHANDSDPARIYAGTGDISSLTLFSGKETRILAGNDIADIAFYIQNVGTSDVSVVAAGGNITAYDSALTAGNTHMGGIARAGDIQINGPGTIEVLAGGNLDLGTGPNFSDGTGMGLLSVGNTRNPYLPFAGANIVAGAGIGAVGIDNSAIDFTSFISKFLDPSSGGTKATRYLPELRTLLEPLLPNEDLTNATNQEVWTAFEKLSASRQELLALDIFYLVLRDAGRDHSDSTSAGYKNYDAGYAAIDALFPGDNWKGNISLTSREIKTKNGGNISLFAPGGALTVGYEVSGAQAIDQGILTEHGGDISIFTYNSVNVGTSRIFTLRGGNEIIWSTVGDIAAGTSSKTVQSAPPTRVLIDPQSGDVKTDLAGLATGGGIGALETVSGVTPSDIDLIAPSGAIDAGDAGIRASGNLTVSAVQILNASNIQVGGASTGTPVAAVSSIGNLQISTQNTTPTNNVSGEDRAAAQRRAEEQQREEIPSVITVEVIGYGGGEGD